MDAFAFLFDRFVFAILSVCTGGTPLGPLTLSHVVVTTLATALLVAIPASCAAYIAFTRLVPSHPHKAPDSQPQGEISRAPAKAAVSEGANGLLACCRQRLGEAARRTVVRLKTSRDPPYSWRQLTLKPADTVSIEALRSAVRVRLARDLAAGDVRLGGLVVVHPTGRTAAVEKEADIAHATQAGAAIQAELVYAAEK
jgi:hypothetical protein